MKNDFKLYEKDIVRNTSILVDEINDYQLIDNLIVDIKKAVEIDPHKELTNVIGQHTQFNALTENPNFINFIKLIKKQIFYFYRKKEFRMKEVWGNIYSNNDHYTKMHCHGESSAFCGILYCTDGPGPGTYFNDYDLTIEEKKGRFVLFHPMLFHEVKKFDYKKERITIAWNFFQSKPWQDKSFLSTYKI
jgi:hypothetical protein